MALAKEHQPQSVSQAVLERLALQDVNKPIGVAEYQYLLPKNKLQELVANEMKNSSNDND